MGMPSGYLPLTTTASISNNMFMWDTGIMTLELIKYSESFSSGAFTIPTGPAILAFVGGRDTTAGARLVSESGGAVTVIVRYKPTCSVSTKDVYVPLGAVPIRAFTGVGSASPEKRFSISLDCAGGDAGLERKIHTTLTDHTNPANQADTLSLAPGSGASGIGIQVLNGSTVIKYGPDSSALGNINQWQAGSSGNGTFNIPLTARYVQTAPAITPGSANGLATFTMSYE
jgi:type 1 fimbria pilin